MSVGRGYDIARMTFPIHRLLILVVACSYALQTVSSAADATAQRKPNVLLIVADDLGWRDLGYAGSTFYESPHIDALSRRGAVFTSAYAACPVCSPSRAALMTGRYPARVGVTNYIGGPQPRQAATRPLYRDRLLPAPYREQLALEETTIAETFRDAGCATLCAGKWHLGGRKFSPEQQGFEETMEVTRQARRAPPAASGAAAEPSGVGLAQRAAAWIADQSTSGKPFFLYFASHDPHIPLRPAPADVAYFEAKRARLKLTDEFAPEGASSVRQSQSHAVYAATIKALDDAVGILVQQLEAQALLDDTIIVFTSDNGGLSTAEGTPTSNTPLRGGKGWAYEGGIRVPLIASIPGVTRPGQMCDARATSTDLFPTLMSASGLPPRPNDHLDGVDLVPALRNDKLADRPLFWHYPHYGNQGGSPFSAIRSGDWKLIAFHDPEQAAELFNMAADPGETKSLTVEQPDRVAVLHRALEEWKHSVGAVDATVSTGR